MIVQTLVIMLACVVATWAVMREIHHGEIEKLRSLYSSVVSDNDMWETRCNRSDAEITRLLLVLHNKHMDSSDPEKVKKILDECQKELET